MRKGPCPICSEKPLHELIDLNGRPSGACQVCKDGYANLKRVFEELVAAGLSEREADRKLCLMVLGEKEE